MVRDYIFAVFLSVVSSILWFLLGCTTLHLPIPSWCKQHYYLLNLPNRLLYLWKKNKQGIDTIWCLPPGHYFDYDYDYATAFYRYIWVIFQYSWASFTQLYFKTFSLGLYHLLSCNVKKNQGDACYPLVHVWRFNPQIFLPLYCSAILHDLKLIVQA